MLLEVCCGSLASAIAAVQGGAQRIELCSALSVDGLTPSIGLLRELRQRYPHLLIHVLIRPREGNFVYTEDEIQVMLRDIAAAEEAGASAIVSGALTSQSTIDLTTTSRLVRAAGDLPFTFHRAFDLVPDPFAALQQLQHLRVQRILTSGGAPTAEAGIPLLRQLVQRAAALSAKSPLPHGEGTGVGLLPGGGVTRHNARRILQETGATEIHGSCSVTLPNGLRQTSADEVREVLKLISH